MTAPAATPPTVRHAQARPGRAGAAGGAARAAAPLAGAGRARVWRGYDGTVTLIRRFDSATNLNIHVHCLVLDGMYRCVADGDAKFVDAAALQDVQVQAVLQTIITGPIKPLTRGGVLAERMGETYLTKPGAEGDEARMLRSVTGSPPARAPGRRC